jgi:GT2 family glycosyltransferase
MLSLIVCTRNRCESLARCLGQLGQINLPTDQWEVIVVDNGSTDGTPAWLEKFAREASFRVSAVVASQPGQGRARNAGIAAAKGDIIAFTDDDCYVDDDFLNSIEQIFRSTDVGCIGGRILLHDPSDARITIKEDETVEILDPNSFVEAGFIMGANMAMRREVIDRIGGFDEQFGPGTSFVADDVEFIARASHAGYRVGYFPQPVVYHHHQRKPGPAVERLSRTYDHGRGGYYAKVLLFGSPRLVYLKYWYWSIRSCLRLGKYQVPVRELCGALHYTLLALCSPKTVRMRAGD